MHSSLLFFTQLFVEENVSAPNVFDAMQVLRSQNLFGRSQTENNKVPETVNFLHLLFLLKLLFQVLCDLYEIISIAFYSSRLCYYRFQIHINVFQVFIV